MSERCDFEAWEPAPREPASEAALDLICEPSSDTFLLAFDALEVFENFDTLDARLNALEGAREGALEAREFRRDPSLVPKVDKQDFLQVFQGCRMEKII